jgi:hypothetical protein
MDIKTTKMPYADYVTFPDNQIDSLKPVTDGPFKFTRLDIIDKYFRAATQRASPLSSPQPVLPPQPLK